MITKWYKNALRTLLSSGDGYNDYKVKAINGAWLTNNTIIGGGFIGAYSSHNIDITNYGYDRGEVLIGSGTTPPTQYDYCMENQITSGITSSMYARRLKDQNGNPGFKCQYTINNVSQNPITIAEIGLVGSIGNGQGPASCFLADRTVLTTPLVIPPGEYRILVYELYTDLSDLANLT